MHSHLIHSILLTEPMVTCVALYESFVYGLLFFSLEAFPIVFVDHRHWETVISTLPYLGSLVGVIFALFINVVNHPLYKKAVERNNGGPVPEARLPPVVVGSVFFSAGMSV